MAKRVPRSDPARGTPGISRRRLLRLGGGLGAATALGGALGACGRAGSAEPATSGAVTLDFWTHDDAYVDFFREAAANTQDATPFTFRLSPTRAGATDVVTKTIAQAIAGRGTPDVAGLEIGAFPRMLRGVLAEELLADLSDAVADVRDDLLTVRTDPFTHDGRLLALDSDAPLVVYYYRDSEFQRLGLPTDVETWEELLDVGVRAHERHGVSFGAVAAGSDLPQIVQGFDMLLMQRGGRLFDEDGQLAIESEEAHDALDFLARAVQGGFLTTVSDYMGPAMQAGLKSGRIIGQYMGTWYKIYGLVPNVPEQSGEWRIRPLPVFPGGGTRTSFTGGTGFAALRDKEHTQAGIELITSAYLTPAEQVRRYEVLGYLPTLRSVYDEPALQRAEDEYCGGQRMFEVYQDVIDEAPSFSLSPDKPILDTVLSGYLLRCYRGQISPREALRRAAEDFHGQTRS